MTHGDPNGKGLARWQPVGKKPEAMEVGNDFKPVPVPGSQAKFNFWKNFLLTGSE